MADDPVTVQQSVTVQQQQQEGNTRPWWAGKEGYGLWIGIVCNALVFARVAPSLLHLLQHTTPGAGENFGEAMLVVMVAGIFPLPAVGAFFAWCDTTFGRNKKAKDKGEWGVALCLLTPLFWIMLALCTPLN